MFDYQGKHLIFWCFARLESGWPDRNGVCWGAPSPSGLLQVIWVVVSIHLDPLNGAANSIEGASIHGYQWVYRSKKKQKPQTSCRCLLDPFLTNSDLRVRLSLGIKMRSQVEVLAASPSNKVLSWLWPGIITIQTFIIIIYFTQK